MAEPSKECTAHCILCHTDFIPVWSGDGGHSCPNAPKSFDDAKKRLEASFTVDCETCKKNRVNYEKV